MNISINTDNNKNINTCIENLCKNLNKPKVIVVICEFSKFKDAMEILHTKYKNATIIGTSGYSYMNNSTLKDSITIWSISEDVQVECGVLEHSTTFPIANIKQLSDNVAKINPTNSNTICLEFCTSGEEMIVSTFNSILPNNNIPLIGGTAFGCSESGEKYVYLNGTFYENSCVYVLIKNLKGRIKVYRENIYKTTQFQFTATKVDERSRSIIELNNKPAAHVYSQCLGINENDINNYVFKNPLGRIIGTDVFITAIKGIGKNSSIECYKKIYKNDIINILDIEHYDSVIQNTVNKIKADNSNPSFIFTVNCANRFILFENDGYNDEYLKKLYNLCPHVGVIAEGEQFMTQHVNQTMLCAVFE